MAVRVHLIDWWRRRRITAPRLDRVEYYESQAELLESLPRHQLAVVGAPKRPKWLILECPCGKGHRLQVNLSTARQPSWRLVDIKTGPNVVPSVDFHAPERRCHFWIREGRVRWCK